MSERGKFEMWAKDFYPLDMDADPETGATDYLEGDTLAAWCGWQAAKAESAAELAALRADYENSCKLVADMWEAATGSKDGPKAGIVEDIAALRAELEDARKDADNYWNDDDRERNYSSISEFLNEEMCNGTPIEVGSTFTLLRAVSLPKVTIRVTSVDEEASEADYEIVDAAMKDAP